MSYATFDFYVEEYGGRKLNEYDFTGYANRASDYIDYVTLGRAAAYDDAKNALKRCCCALADQMEDHDVIRAEVSAGAVASETVGPHSVSYRSIADLKAEQKKALDEIISMYLLPTGLLYRGVPCIRLIP